MTDLGSSIPGAAYRVTSVNDQPPDSLDQFVSGNIVQLTADRDDQLMRIHGSAHADGNTVVIYQLQHATDSTEVHTWRVTRSDGCFEATRDL
jgi:hypothetical protein